MKAIEKNLIQLKLMKTILKFIDKNAKGLPYRDFIAILFAVTNSLVRFCLREGRPDLKRNSRKIKREADELFRAWADASDQERSKALTFKDDEEE